MGKSSMSPNAAPPAQCWATIKFIAFSPPMNPWERNGLEWGSHRKEDTQMISSAQVFENWFQSIPQTRTQIPLPCAKSPGRSQEA